ncbi:chromate transporter [Rouxiella silvae]|uniref:Chromate transporter n=1 Tax=Rouxiella silvae TaxID=1646373 RepID=A0AA40X3H7_9GAMM|nr:chromate transporter [Rouxiella silvae]KQN46558.1 chromate transporter [Serratia sp. Leaf50]MBF6638017.1 chromate transporter [Rouxiella silvae]ORJ20108.1 chromate transporter [Rouxiella silvae]
MSAPLNSNVSHENLPAHSGITPNCRELFIGFFMLGLTGFGGVLPMARRMIVEKKNWLSGDEFTELLGLCQFLPGGNIINLSVALGNEFQGLKGALAAILGLICAPTAIVVGLGLVYARYQNDVVVEHLFAGLAAGAAGLLLSTGIKMLLPLRGKWLQLAIVTLGVIAIAVLRLPMLSVMLVLAPISILLFWRSQK